MIELDLREKTLVDVMILLEKNGFGTLRSTDISNLYGPHQEYKSFICIFLPDDKSAVHASDTTFILWDGRRRPPRPGRDIHGFVLPDGTIWWGLANTMNLMR